MPDSIDAVIVGAGPAGAAAAFHLARRGRRVVLLERSAFPRDKSCGDAVNRAGVRLLEEMGVLDDLPGAWAIGGLEVSMGPSRARNTRSFRYGRADGSGGRYGIVVPRSVLDHALVRRAVAAGAEFRQRVLVRGLVREDGVVRGVEAVTSGSTEIIRARVVVAADGSTSKLARQSGLVETSRGRLGYAMRTYFSGVPALEDTLGFHMPLDNPATHSRLPAYGWIIPLGRDRANIGAGVAEKHPGVQLNDLFDRFVAELRSTVPWFADARQEGPPKGAPLFFGFTPDRSWSPGLVLTGDAAGMINPGTGEGISFALESGKIAAEVIDGQLSAGQVEDLSSYSATLIRRFSGHLETGRHAVNRHRLAWRVLEDTFDSDRPVFALTRRAMLAPDHTAGFETTAPGALDDIRHCLDPRLRLAAPLVEVGEILADTVRKDWPFLDRLPGLLSEEYLMAPRPAMLVLLAAAAYRPVRRLTSLAAATDLAALAAIAQASVDIAPPAGTRPGGARPGGARPDGARPDGARTGGARRSRANWGTMFAVLTTDLFLARAFELCATQDTQVTAQLARAIEDACHGRMAELTADLPAGPAALTAAGPALGPVPSRRWLDLLARSGTAALCAAACEIGATAAGAPEAEIEALGRYGRKLGAAAQLADDLRRLSGGLDRLGRDTLADLDELDTPNAPDTPDNPNDPNAKDTPNDPNAPDTRVDRGEPDHPRARGRRGLPSIPFRLALPELDGDVEDLRTSRAPRQERAAKLAAMIGRTTAPERTATWIQELCQQAQHALQDVPDSPARSTLHAIADHLHRTAQPDRGASP